MADPPLQKHYLQYCCEWSTFLSMKLYKRLLCLGTFNLTNIITAPREDPIAEYRNRLMRVCEITETSADALARKVIELSIVSEISPGEVITFIENLVNEQRASEVMKTMASTGKKASEAGELLKNAMLSLKEPMFYIEGKTKRTVDNPPKSGFVKDKINKKKPHWQR